MEDKPDFEKMAIDALGKPLNDNAERVAMGFAFGCNAIWNSHVVPLQEKIEWLESAIQGEWDNVTFLKGKYRNVEKDLEGVKQAALNTERNLRSAIGELKQALTDKDSLIASQSKEIAELESRLEEAYNREKS